MSTEAATSGASADAGGPAKAGEDPTGVRDIEWSDAPYIVFSGACMGTADTVPGVSGGTMAVALGIYRQLLAAISSVSVRSVKALLTFKLKEAFVLLHWRFIASLGAGLATAIIVMVKVFELPHLVETKPTYVYAVFFGLVLASAGVLARRMSGWNGLRVVWLIVGAGLGFAVVNLVPVETPENPAFVFLCGVVAITAMLLPGISGSFILLILGKYAYILGSISPLNLGVLIPFALGCGTGILVFSRVLGWMLDKFHGPMIAALTGLLLGSLWRIWPYQHLKTIVVREKPRVIEATPFWPESFEGSVAGLMVLGVAIVVVVEVIAARRRTRAAHAV